MTKIIIQGAGTVGKSTEMFLKQYNTELDIVFNDPAKDLTANGDDWKEAKWVIVCVNTDLDENLTLPENNTINLDAAINQALENKFEGGIVIRSTIGVECATLLLKQLGQNLIMWPEYIREATWQEDSIDPKFVILGGDKAEEFANIFVEYKGNTFITDPVEAMIAKLSTNTFLAMKVIFANQLKQLCDANNADYNVVSSLLKNEGRLGPTHWDVPGPDGQLGFGGKCFPKDTRTFETALVKCNIHIDLIRAITDINSTIRPDQ